MTQEQTALPYQHNRTEATTLNRDSYSHIYMFGLLERQSDYRVSVDWNVIGRTFLSEKIALH